MTYDERMKTLIDAANDRASSARRAVERADDTWNHTRETRDAIARNVARDVANEFAAAAAEIENFANFDGSPPPLTDRREGG